MRRSQGSSKVSPNGKHPGVSVITLVDQQSETVEPTPGEAPARRNGRSPGNGLDAKRERAIALMIEGLALTQVATTLRVHRSTLYRWQAEPAFERKLSLRRDDFLEKTFDLQAYASTLAVRKLMELLDSEDERVALRAAETLAAAGRTYALINQERRIRRLEDNLPFLVEGAY